MPRRRLASRSIGAYKLRDLTVERVGAWSASIQRVMAPTSARVALIVLGQACRYAARRGWLSDNPVAKLEPAEKPHWRPQRTASLEPDQLARLLDPYSHLFAARDHAASARQAHNACHAAVNGLRASERPGFMETAVETDAAPSAVLAVPTAKP